MGRCSGDFSKKEREQKRQKKKEAKAKRKEERKNNPEEKGDNLTYVDEYGNFHETPPDPKKKVKAENIVLGVPPKGEEEEEDPIRKGVVTFFNDSKGYGFIKDKSSGESIFVHINACEGGDSGK
ncbi:MAG: cold shock domain-containing protein [Owenweeksia sp.]|nr:cold shock domain-containing protein [Owenweeksia sp.]